MKKNFVSLSLSLLLFIVSSCVGSQHPLNPLSESIADQRLIGSWHACDPDAKDASECGFMHVGKVENEKYLRAILVGYDGGAIDSITMDLNITRIDERYYISVPLHELEKKEKEEMYFILFYEFQSPDNFIVHIMASTTPVVTAIKEGALKGGKIEKYGATITDTPEKIREFLSTADHKELFEPAMVFTRVPPPVLPISNQPMPEREIK